RGEGVTILESIRVERFERGPFGVSAHVAINGQQQRIDGSHLLVAAGRRPNIDGLNLEAAGIDYERTGIKVTRGLKTSNVRVYAIGDVAGGLQFTHVANYHAGLVIRNALFRMPVKVNPDIVPWVTFTEPELAHVGLTEDDAKKRHGAIRVLSWPYLENDRAPAERQTDGFVKVITTRRGRILGASIVGEHAGELIQMWVLAITKKMKIGAMTGIISPYPTFSEINKRVAYTYYLPSLTNPMIRRIIGLLRKLG
ncbi:MAG: FAD-dependent oxidoreductase, partial [Methyloligellaceae bacterium]